MKIRRKTLEQYEAVPNNGDLNTLIVWLVAQQDFNFMTVYNNMTIVIDTQENRTVSLVVNDWVRINDNNRLDKIRADAFDANWEVIDE